MEPISTCIFFNFIQKTRTYFRNLFSKFRLKTTDIILSLYIQPPTVFPDNFDLPFSDVRARTTGSGLCCGVDCLGASSVVGVDSVPAAAFSCSDSAALGCGDDVREVAGAAALPKAAEVHGSGGGVISSRGSSMIGLGARRSLFGEATSSAPAALAFSFSSRILAMIFCKTSF